MGGSSSSSSSSTTPDCLLQNLISHRPYLSISVVFVFSRVSGDYSRDCFGVRKWCGGMPRLSITCLCDYRTQRDGIASLSSIGDFRRGCVYVRDRCREIRLRESEYMCVCMCVCVWLDLSMMTTSHQPQRRLEQERQICGIHVRAPFGN